MELRQLEHFVAVATHGNFTKAAREVHVVQSTLSASVFRLEQDIGAVLLERTTRRVHLTVAGRALLPVAQRMLGDANIARHSVAAVTGLLGGSVSIGTIQELVWVDLVAAVGSFNKDHPGVDITIREAPVDDLIESLLSGELDLAYIARDFHPLPEGVVTLASHDEELVFAVSATHPLAGRREIDAADLRDVPFVNFEAGPGLESIVSRYCEQVHLDRKVTVHTTQLPMLIRLVAQGLGAAIIPATMAQHPGVCSIPLAAPRPRRTVALIAREHRPSNPAAFALLHHLQDTSPSPTAS